MGHDGNTARPALGQVGVANDRLSSATRSTSPSSSRCSPGPAGFGIPRGPPLAEGDTAGAERKLMDVSISHVKQLVEIVSTTFPELVYAPTA